MCRSTTAMHCWEAALKLVLKTSESEQKGQGDVGTLHKKPCCLVTESCEQGTENPLGAQFSQPRKCLVTQEKINK